MPARLALTHPPLAGCVAPSSTCTCATVTFKDFTPLLADGALFRQCIEVLAARYRSRGVTHVASCEARGLALGAPLALTLGCGFVPLRKPR